MLLIGAGCKFRRRKSTQAAVWPASVVVDPPGFEDPAGVFQAHKQMLVEALVAQPADEALGKSVLHRFARGDVMPVDTALLLPGEDRVRSQLGAVIADDQARQFAESADPVEFAGNTP